MGSDRSDVVGRGGLKGMKKLSHHMSVEIESEELKLSVALSSSDEARCPSDLTDDCAPWKYQTVQTPGSIGSDDKVAYRHMNDYFSYSNRLD
jgi:hypothetical protein